VATSYPRDLTDIELRTVARVVARSVLEVERGHRPAKALRNFLAPHLYHGLSIATPQPGVRPVSGGDVGNATFTRLSATTGYAAVAIRELDGAWDALTMVLRRAKPARWQFIDIARASRYRPATGRRAERTG
jgi:hypothetical protein